MSETLTRRPIRFVMLGGFLGSGKTTALLRLAAAYSARGQRVGIITNDQAEGLVDTLAFREAGFSTEEIPSGCFCCHFDKLLEASGRLADGLDPDIILAEPVGSCTDLVHAVIAPLKKLYADRFSVAPYAVLADPERLVEALSGGGPDGFSRKVTYLYKMQQNEADIIAVNKIDRLSDGELAEVRRLVERNFPAAAHLAVSARTGAGFEALLARLDLEVESGLHPAPVDYALYTEGEVALGWLNAKIQLSAPDAWDGNEALLDLADRIHRSLVAGQAEVAHFKMRLMGDHRGEGAVNGTSNHRGCEVTRRLDGPIYSGGLVVNLRAEAEPALLRGTVLETLTDFARERGLNLDVVQCESFAPNPPVPPPPSRLTVRI